MLIAALLTSATVMESETLGRLIRRLDWTRANYFALYQGERAVTEENQFSDSIR